MARVEVNKEASDFSLLDFEGNLFRLSSFQGEKHVLLVFNRGFM